MAKTVKEMLEAANIAVPKIDKSEAERLIDDGALVVDVRDGTEVAASGKVAGALNVSRGMIEFRADEQSPYYDKAFRRDRPVVVYCASGGRSALAGQVLTEMGFEKVYNMGGLKDWCRGRRQGRGRPGPDRRRGRSGAGADRGLKVLTISRASAPVLAVLRLDKGRVGGRCVPGVNGGFHENTLCRFNGAGDAGAAAFALAREVR